MVSNQNAVHYCSVSRGNRTLYVYSGGDHEIENLAALCLERTPPFHKWYFETIGKRTYGFLIEDVYVYFLIADEGLGNRGALQFLEHLRDEFKKVAKKGLRGSFSGMNAISIQEQLVPVIRRLITSLENVSQRRDDWKAETPLSDRAGLSPSPNNANGKIEVATSTKAPLLGKPSKLEKKKAKDHVIAMRDVELEEHRKSTDRAQVDSIALDSNSQNGAGPSISLQKDLGSMRMRSSSQSIRKKWWHQVRIVLLIDAAVESTENMSLDLASERVCYVHCNYCNTILAVSVPCSSLFNIVTVRCGHCANLLNVNMLSALQTLPLQDPQQQKQHLNLEDSTKDSGSSSKCNKFSSAFESAEHEAPRMPPICPPEKRQRVPSAYNRFIKEEIQRIKASNPEISHREAFSTAAKNWAHFPHIHFGLKLDSNKQSKLDKAAYAEGTQKSNGFY